MKKKRKVVNEGGKGLENGRVNALYTRINMTEPTTMCN